MHVRGAIAGRARRNEESVRGARPASARGARGGVRASCQRPERAARIVREDESRAVAIVAVDYLVSLDALCAWVRAAPSRRPKIPPPLSEGAAAIVVTLGGARARREAPRARSVARTRSRGRPRERDRD